MLENVQGTNVTFAVGGHMFPAHQCILVSQSIMFRAELFDIVGEKVAQRIEAQYMESSVFEALLQFVYANSLPGDDHDDDVAENRKVDL
jgi:speckle-type POZ protein